jgi:kinesin family protein 3/17
MNDVSSRSHAVFIIIVEQMTTNMTSSSTKEIRVGKLNLVDLAGSERVRVTGATGKRLEECKKIN